MEKPTELVDIDFIGIKELCHVYLDLLASKNRSDDELADYRHYIFETLLTSIFGRDVWVYVNENS